VNGPPAGLITSVAVFKRGVIGANSGQFDAAIIETVQDKLPASLSQQGETDRQIVIRPIA